MCRACLAHLCRTLFFEVACFLARLWRACFTSDCMNRRVSQIPFGLQPSSLQQSDVSGPEISHRQWKRRDKSLVLAMTIHRPSYLLFLNCRVVFDQSALCKSKKLVIVVINISD